MRDKKVCFLLPVLSLTLLSLGACTDRVEGVPAAVPWAESTSNSPTRHSASPEDPRAESSGSSEDSTSDPGAGGEDPEGSAGSGPGGAPWDPCLVLTWLDMPEETPDSLEAARPVPVSPEKGRDDRFNAGCQWLGKRNEVILLWGPSSKAKVKKPDSPGEQEITVAGYIALQAVTIDDNALLRSIIQVDLGEDLGVIGLAAAARSQDTEGDRHPSVVARTLTELIIERTVG